MSNSDNTTIPPLPKFITSDRDWRALQLDDNWLLGMPQVLRAPWSEQIRGQARECLSKGQYQLGVLLSAVACELHTEAALEALMAHRAAIRDSRTP